MDATQEEIQKIIRLITNALNFADELRLDLVAIRLSEALDLLIHDQEKKSFN
jgi:hypothetical protein